MRTFLAVTACIAATFLPATSPMAFANAESEPPGTRPDPLDAQASVPPVEYRSAFTNYRPLGEDKLAPWKDANEATARAGGWRAYAKEAQEAAPAAADAATPAPAHKH